MLRFILFLLMSIVSSSGLIAQTLTVTVRDVDRQPLPGAVVSTVNTIDSSTASTFTNSNGVAVFDRLKPGIYNLEVSHVSYQPLEKTVLVRSGGESVELRMKDRISELGAFTVTATRPLIRQEDDKMIIDPEPLANIATSTLEVLESTPGLFVDQDGGIYLNSATPAKVYINGREQKMSSQDINTILRSLPPGSVERIEVLRTPSTKYDAASSGGIINIILKKGYKIGKFGSVNVGMNQGFYGNHFVGFTFNNSGDKSTRYINVNYNSNEMLEEINASRLMWPDTFLVQEARTRSLSRQGYVGYGINYDIKENITFSYDGRINLSFRESEGKNLNRLETAEFITAMKSDNAVNNYTGFFNIQQDLGLIVKLDTTGNEWDTRFGYGYTGSDLDQDYSSDYSFPLTTVVAGSGSNLQNRHFLLFQSDLALQLPFGIKGETGAKTTWQDVGSDAEFFTNIKDSAVYDPRRSNSYSYGENITAGYAQASRTLMWDILLKAGVRMEYTGMFGKQSVPVDTSFLVNRADWFPYLYLSRKLFSLGKIELRGFIIYRKTINRPDYQSLNPTIRIVDQFLYETGNPALKPQFTDNFELNISYNEFPVAAIGRNYTRDIFSPVVYQDDSPEKAAVRTWDNLGKNRETYLRGLIGIPPGKNYFFALGGQYNYTEYDGFYENQPFSYKRGSWRFFTYHSLTIFKETRLTLSGFLMHKGNYNFYELETFGMLNLGLTQTLLNKKLRITLSARDVLRTMVTSFELNQGSVITSGDRYTDNQRFGINIRYNFGIKDKEEDKTPFQMEEEGI